MYTYNNCSFMPMCIHIYVCIYIPLTRIVVYIHESIICACMCTSIDLYIYIYIYIYIYLACMDTEGGLTLYVRDKYMHIYTNILIVHGCAYVYT
jgi:hypothetical protein